MALPYAVEEPLTATTQHNNDNKFDTNPAQVLLVASGLLHRFVTRTDNYAVQQSNGDYYPQNCELTLVDLQNHVAGDTTIGIYPIDKDDKVKFLALDIDVNKEHTDKVLEYLPALQDTACKLLSACEDLGLHALLEFSGRKGYHVILLFEELFPAAQAKQLGRVLISKIGMLPDGLHIEIFPKQDSISGKKGLGNLLKLPFALHKVSGQRSELLNPTNFQPVDDPVRTLDEVQRNSAMAVKRVIGNSKVDHAKLHASNSGIQLNQPGLASMIEHCPIIRMFEENPCGWDYDPWVGVGSNYLVKTGGWDRFTELSKREPERFSQEKLDDLYCDIAENWNGPQSYETFADQGVKFELPVGAPKAPAGWASKYDPIDSPIVERSGCYGKIGKNGDFIMLTPFTIDAGELLMLPDGDVLNCTIKHISGQEWTGITIENTDWHTRGKFMKATKHSEGTFHGSDLDVIDVCQHVISKVAVRKQGTRSIGLHDDIWVVRDLNLTAAGQINPMQIMPFDKSSDSLHARVKYSQMSDTDYASIINTFFNNILAVNQPEVMLPILGWFFAVPLKPRITDLVGSFPALFCYGTQGGGKTSLLELMMSLHGYDDPVVSSCTMKQFPMLKLLSSTNAVPVVLDEFKPYDMRDGQVMDLTRMLRKVYRGEIEDKGNPDQTVTHYHLTAPVVLCGESKVKESAVLERVLIAGFTDEIKKNSACQTAFRSLKGLDLQAFMTQYIPFCLGVDVAARLADAENTAKALYGDKHVAPRIQNNITAMVFGLTLMQDFAAKYGISMAGQIDLQKAIDIQIEEVTGAGNGQVKLSFDYLLEQLAIMAERDLAKQHVDYAFVNIRSLDSSKEYLAIHLRTAAQVFAANASRIGYDGEISDYAAYQKQLDSRKEFVVKTNHPVRFKNDSYGKKSAPKKCIIVDIELATTLGLDLSGFEAISRSLADDDESQTPNKKTPKQKPFDNNCNLFS
ncbi:MAG: hypothetical protein KDB65_12115 [Calditrichaeota bacterium]|nr:hypothetical protein [Calditrichota bacterium]MCB9367558.1 hypothetical protein [Calditrichota bacterium]